jgi:hypothetical protein
MITFQEFLTRVFAQSDAVELPRDLKLMNPRAWEGCQIERTRGEGFQMINSREFDPHDDSLADVDWPASSVSTKLIVIDYDSIKRTIVHLVLDMGRSMEMGTRRVDKIGLLAELACILIKALIEARNHIAAHFFSESRLLRSFGAYEAQGLLIPLLKTIYELGHQGLETDSLWQGSLLEELIKLGRAIFTSRKNKGKPSPAADQDEEDDNGNNEAESGFCKALRAIPRSGEKRLVVIPSDFQNKSEEDFTQLEQLARIHVVCCLVLVQPGDYELPPTDGSIVYQDLTTGERVPVQVDPEQRKQYKDQFETWWNSLKTRLEDAGCRCDLFCTKDPPEEIRNKLAFLLSSKR